MITQTPWSFQQDSITERDGCGYISDADGNHISHHGNINRSRAENLANAAFIVRAVNSHDVLVKALEGAEIAVAELCHDQNPANECWNILSGVRAALASAREVQS
jgi:selenocysteine lyase/cysteine desulfurase